ncbi:hypothetical protein [Pseudomonas sp. F3-2]|uniref:hypothetical protein n=1 Tax=Pseudomonas sp. F3-2 TaxID=3141539 RepID=UPI00315DC59A
MQAQHQSSGEPKATTLQDQATRSARHLMAIRIVGTALFDYQVRKSADARIRLECLATMAHQLGDLSEKETAVVAQLLARPTSTGACV